MTLHHRRFEGTRRITRTEIQ